MPVTQLFRVVLTVSDLDQTTRFFRDALGLKMGLAASFEDARWNALLGLNAGTKIRTADMIFGADMGFGGETLTLATFDPAGVRYPSPRASNDPWFEHVALVAGDIQAVWRGLEKAKSETVTVGGPVLLPPNTGSVTAFKFRDPEGHPLELISFPAGVGDARWQQGKAGIRGFDHTAIVVANLQRSLAFYTKGLGMRVGGQSLNQGPEQDRLDGLTGCLVDVVALQPRDRATPHLELLHYRSPPGRAPVPHLSASDVASVRQVYQVDELEALVVRLESASAEFVSDGVVCLGDSGNGVAIRDPDGHMIVLFD